MSAEFSRWVSNAAAAAKEAADTVNVVCGYCGPKQKGCDYCNAVKIAAIAFHEAVMMAQRYEDTTWS